jgi:hypothetical protein
VEINGQLRTFSLMAGSMPWGHIVGDASVKDWFSVQGSASDGFLISITPSDTALGTYQCMQSLGGADIFLTKNDNQGNPEVNFGKQSDPCTVSVTQYSPSKGGHVMGTFSGELSLQQGNWPTDKLVLTNGLFDVAMIGDQF